MKEKVNKIDDLRLKADLRNKVVNIRRNYRFLLYYNF